MNQVEAVCSSMSSSTAGLSARILRLLETSACRWSTHSVLREPTSEQRDITVAIADRSDRVVVMSERAREILQSVYGIARERIAMIPHGVPDVPFLDTSFNKDRFDLVGRKVILTFGLLSEGKGIEYVIDALPQIVKEHPEVVYVVVGATHPEVRRREGEAYRHALQRRAHDLGVEQNIVFYNQFIDTPTLLDFISTADLVVTPYLGQEQMSRCVELCARRRQGGDLEKYLYAEVWPMARDG